MSGLSRRFAPHLVALCALALAAVAVHSWLGLGRDDCADPEAFLGRPGAGDSPRGRFMAAAFEALAWREGRIATDGRVSSLSWSIVRSFSPRRVYYQPENALQSARPARRAVEWLDAQGERIPVHRAWYSVDPASGATFIAAYVLIYRGEAVADPVRAQLWSAPVLFVRGAAPMTLLFVGGPAQGSELAEAEALARDWLGAAWRSYRSACEE